MVVPAYNAAGPLRRALKSVLAQSLAPDEILCVDDGSEDGTVEAASAVLAEARVRRTELIRLAHAGPGAARNAGIRTATGDWVAFLDADDEWKPQKLAALVAAIRDSPNAGFLCHDEEEVDWRGRRRELRFHQRYEPSRSFFLQLYTKGCFVGTSAIAVRRQILYDAGLFDERMPSAQDYDLWLRVSLRAEPVFLPDMLGIYHRGQQSISSRIEQRLAATLQICRRYYPELQRVSGRPREVYRQRMLRFHASALRAWWSYGGRGAATPARIAASLVRSLREAEPGAPSGRG